ncbi:MAG: hypothetical protein HY518_03805 [Candidatus Aenigmarchaeota archaeon]|nr:hypothetical protein [Candidatus Aenigmarchaeota archaeon]
MFKASADERIYVMEKAVMNENYPWKNEDGSRPYHDIYYAIATGGLGSIAEVSTPEEVIELLKTLSGKNPIIMGRHPSLPECVNIKGDVEKYNGWRPDSGQLDELNRSGIEFSYGLP